MARQRSPRGLMSSVRSDNRHQSMGLVATTRSLFIQGKTIKIKRSECAVIPIGSTKRDLNIRNARPQRQSTLGERSNVNHVALKLLNKRMSDRNIELGPGNGFGIGLSQRDNDPIPIQENSQEHSEGQSPDPATTLRKFSRLTDTPDSLQEIPLKEFSCDGDKSVPREMLRESAGAELFDGDEARRSQAKGQKIDSWVGRTMGLNLRESIAISSTPGNSHSYIRSGDVSNWHSEKIDPSKRQKNKRVSLNLTKNEKNKRGSFASLKWTPNESDPRESHQSF
jgi:hypothetical protein